MENQNYLEIIEGGGEVVEIPEERGERDRYIGEGGVKPLAPEGLGIDLHGLEIGFVAPAVQLGRVYIYALIAGGLAEGGPSALGVRDAVYKRATTEGDNRAGIHPVQLQVVLKKYSK